MRDRFAVLFAVSALAGCGSAPPARGTLPRDVIQRVVRAHAADLRLCYLARLRDDPHLAGRVVVRFVINRDGTVSDAEDAGSSMPDAEVVRCTVGRFRTFSFPPPDGGVVPVTYPIVLDARD